jgi:hypothetical protein
MSILGYEFSKNRIRSRTGLLLIATVFAVVATIGDWFLVPAASLVNLTSADFNDSPWLAALLLAHMPAVILYITIFGKPGRSRSDAAILFCVFIQWFVVGLGVCLLAAAIRRAMKMT